MDSGATDGWHSAASVCLHIDSCLWTVCQYTVGLLTVDMQLI